MTYVEPTGNFTKVPNKYLEALFKLHLTPTEWQVIVFLIRQTSGYHRDSYAVSLTALAHLLCVNRSSVKRGLDRLIEKQIVLKDRGGSRCQYGINPDCSVWGKRSKKDFEKKDEEWYGQRNEDRQDVDVPF